MSCNVSFLFLSFLFSYNKLEYWYQSRENSHRSVLIFTTHIMFLSAFSYFSGIFLRTFKMIVESCKGEKGRLDHVCSKRAVAFVQLLHFPHNSALFSFEIRCRQYHVWKLPLYLLPSGVIYYSERIFPDTNASSVDFPRSLRTLVPSWQCKLVLLFS